jgi:isoquinoline 1-oxidoreductase alpha subunit
MADGIEPGMETTTIPKDNKPASKPRLSRRAKVAGGIGVAAVAAGAAVGAAVLTRREESIPAGFLKVNGALHKVTAAPETALLYVLKEELGLSGPKFGCGLGQCGACSVLVGDKEMRSCIASWAGIKGAVTTLEGLPARWAAERKLSADQAAKTLHPVQQAWIDEQVPQCGYCQNGMMIMAVDLLHQNPKPTVAQI